MKEKTAMLTRFFPTTTPRPVSLGLRLILILTIGLGLSLPMLPASAQDETEGESDPLDASTLTVNVELIFDSSGSMAELVPDTENQSRMEAAQEAMREVIDGIPERDGLNVGFRIYGHEGSNREADRPVSCRSTELLVPLEGVDRDALLEEVEAAEPTGWTPLALALEAAAEDFAPGGESVTNAIIMVTDGEETCGGDPCQVAGALHAADIGLTTHVVGFALTREQRQAVRCIAEEGGGQLFTADDAAGLSEAVFAAFEQVEAAQEETPVETTAETEVGGYVGGNAFALLDAGTPGELSVVAVGRPGLGDPALVIRNDTGEAVENIQVEIIARADGEIAAVAAAQGLQPFVVEDGGLAIAYGYFSGAEIPEDAEFEFALDADPAGTDEYTSSRDLIVEEVNGTDDAIVGIYSNPHEEIIAGFIINAAVCFDDAGTPIAYVNSTTNNDELEPGQTRPFDVAIALYAEACPSYLVAGYGSAQ
jgi:hypothetical protein